MPSPVKKKKKAKSIPFGQREVVYPEIDVMVCKGDDELTYDQAQGLLGWMSDEENNFGTDYIVKNQDGTKIRTAHNKHNRPFYLSDCMAYKQRILRRRWKFNGETIIIGKYGSVLSGQHTLIAFCLAVEEWRKDPALWSEFWGEDEPTLPKLVVVGIDEDDETVNTIDTGKPRSFTDVLFRSEEFRDIEPKERKLVARTCSYAVSTLWERLGISDTFGILKDHSESTEFLLKHPKLIECSEFIAVENVENSIGKYLSPGYAAGMLYLMACSNSFPQEYLKDQAESSLDFSSWDDAQAFFVLLSSDNPAMKSLKVALGKMLDDDGGSRRERLALIAKAWSLWEPGKKLPKIELAYTFDDDIRKLDEAPSVGGIDLLDYSSAE